MDIKIKLLNIITLVILTITGGYCQNCDYDFEYSLVIIDKNHKQTKETVSTNRIEIEQYMACIQTTQDSTELFWLNNAIARELSELNPSNDSIEFFTKKAFQYNSTRFCRDYVKQYVYFEIDSTFPPMKRHYLDQMNSQLSNDISEYCLSKYEGAELEIYADIESKKKQQKLHRTFNNEYLESLKIISNFDQQERMKESIDWNIQRNLDAKNRVALDSLYAIYGFPSKNKVTDEGVSNSFIILQHSTDCKWNKKWIKRWMQFHNDIDNKTKFAYYFYRNFNAENGVCRENLEFIQELINGKYSNLAKQYLDFDYWENKLYEKK